MIRLDYFGSISAGLKYSLLIHVLIVLVLLVNISRQQELRIPERIVSVEVGFTKSGPITNLPNKITSKQATKEPKIKNPPAELANKHAPVAKIVERYTERIKHHDLPTLKLQQASKDNKEIDNILSQLESQPSVSHASKDQAKSSVVSDKPYDKNKPISIADHDNIRMQIERKLSTPVGIDFKPGELVIRIKLDLKVNGEIGKVIVLNSSTYPTGHADAFSALKDSLIRAVYMANPLQGLSAESYEGAQGWSEIEMAFDAYHLQHNS